MNETDFADDMEHYPYPSREPAEYLRWGLDAVKPLMSAERKRRAPAVRVVLFIVLSATYWAVADSVANDTPLADSAPWVALSAVVLLSVAAALDKRAMSGISEEITYANKVYDRAVRDQEQWADQAPGWYMDCYVPSLERHWDGTTWGGHDDRRKWIEPPRQLRHRRRN